VVVVVVVEEVVPLISWAPLVRLSKAWRFSTRIWLTLLEVVVCVVILVSGEGKMKVL